MSESYFAYKILSINLSVAIISIACVISIPVFPSARTSNETARHFSIFLYTTSSCLLIHEYLNAGIFSLLYKSMRSCFRTTKKLIRGRNGQYDMNSITCDNYVEHWGDTNSIEHNYLGYFFFLGFLSFEIWKIGNEFYLLYFFLHCFEIFYLFAQIAKMSLGIFIMIGIVFKNRLKRHGWFSYFVWSFVAASCFYAVLTNIVEEVTWAYIDIIDKSIKDVKYGLDISPNITTAEEYIEPIFRLRARCVNSRLWGSAAYYLLELLPFAAEYFSFATFFSFTTWSNLDTSEKASISTQIEATDGAEVINATLPGFEAEVTLTRYKKQINYGENSKFVSSITPSEFAGISKKNNDVVSKSVTNSSRDIELSAMNRKIEKQSLKVSQFYLTKSIAMGLGLFFFTFTVVTIMLFCREMHSDESIENGLELFFFQQTFLQIIVFGIELSVYIYFIKKLEGTSSPSSHFKFDILLLIFPLFPLGVLFTLRICPNIMDMSLAPDKNINPEVPYTPLWGILNIFSSVFNWSQVAFQSFFISQLFCRIHHSQLKQMRWIFFLLFILNLCVWLSWTLECKLVTIHGYFQVIGVVYWTVIVYSTVPFVLFCFAHSATCFLDIISYINDESHESVEGHNSHN